MTIATEQRYFEENLTSWLEEHRGEYALVFRQEVRGFYPTAKDGFDAGLAQFGMDADFVVAVVSDPSEAMSGLVTWDYGLLAAV
jgi:hypothetical protein